MSNISFIIRKSFYENTLTHRTLNFLNRCKMDDDYILELRPVLHRQIDINYPNSEQINSQFLHKKLMKLIRIELRDKYSKFQREKSEFEKTLVINESKNTNSRLYKLPMDIINCKICEFL